MKKYYSLATSEVFRALNKTRGLYLRWQEVTRTPLAHGPEAEWTSAELRNAIRSIEWDLEDLEDTISIVERNTSKFKIDNREISERRTFIEVTKQEVKVMKSVVVGNRRTDMDGTREPLLAEESPSRVVSTGSGGGSSGPTWGARLPGYPHYRRLPSASPTRYLEDDALSAQEKMLMSQEDQLHLISNSVGSLKTVSKQIGVELDEQAVMLEDLNTELENADSKLDSTLKKVARVLHMNNDRRQWMAIGVLVGLLFVILILFIIL